MRKKDVMELKKRLTKDKCSFTKMCGCYVNADKEIVVKIKETFLNLEDEEFFKYLEIAKKVLSGTVGNNILELSFPEENGVLSQKQQSFIALKSSELKNDALLDNLYDMIIDSYKYTGNYLILLFHDAYDVITKTKDNIKIDESEEVYEYVLCALCPVSLSEPGLSYIQDANRFGTRARDWVVEMPTVGLVYPAFSDRSSDIHTLMYYTKNPKDSHPEFMEEGLGCYSRQTATEQKESFHSIVCSAIPDEKEANDLFLEIQDSLNSVIEEHNAVSDINAEPIILTNNVISEILTDSGISEEVSQKIQDSYTNEFSSELPIADNLLDTKSLKANIQRKKEKRLESQITKLETELEKTKKEVEEKEMQDDKYDVILNVNPKKVSQIKSDTIDGQKCIIIPLNDDEQAMVNGIDI